ncbi:RICIN domain-containing protein [Paraferrimonas haliotis]|uniref:Ricin B lectin domain-containing protein n=1 Tax=Paraferrimonas haliotis TaxID=2013866 RepID=A0AA37TWA9_9GAMM|nr:RICIN domain-containing protein [Paraferrimonas haliotis]GLS84115.1 hypothetical protein GCM10007894_20920 [Paraferrimonas haliotis]
MKTRARNTAIIVFCLTLSNVSFGQLESGLPQSFTILRQAAHQCLAPIANSIREGSRVNFQACSEQLPQVWRFNDAGQIAHQLSGHCLGTYNNSNQLSLIDCDSNRAQRTGKQINYISFPEPKPIQSVQKGTCTTFSTGSKEVRLMDFECPKEAPQQFWVIQAALVSPTQ